jgi:hypothetical protein
VALAIRIIKPLKVDPVNCKDNRLRGDHLSDHLSDYLSDYSSGYSRGGYLIND